jgi:hypothetical protein
VGSFEIHIGCKKLNLRSFTAIRSFTQAICLHTACALQQSVIILYFMKQYVIDELRPGDYEALKTYLDERYGPAAMDGIYWIPIAAEMLTDIQSEHIGCQPQHFALDLDSNRLACELLSRSKNRVRCDCIVYATEDQRNWIIGLVDNIFDRLQIKT